MNTETKSETCEQYIQRREQELRDTQIASSKIRTLKNDAEIRARYSRFGIFKPLARSQSELEAVAEEDRRVLSDFK